MNFSEPLTQCLCPYSYTPPQTVNNTTISTPVIDMSKFARAQFKVFVGSMGAAGVLAIQAQSSPLVNFATIHNLANCAMTNMTVNNTVQELEIRGDQIQYQFPGDQFFRLNFTGSGNPLTVGALGEGACSPQGPAQQYVNTSVVTQQVQCST